MPKARRRASPTIRELLDRGFGKPFLADNDVVPETQSADELRAEIVERLEQVFPGYEFVPARRLKVISEPAETG